MRFRLPLPILTLSRRTLQRGASYELLLMHGKSMLASTLKRCFVGHVMLKILYLLPAILTVQLLHKHKACQGRRPLTHVWTVLQDQIVVMANGRLEADLTEASSSIAVPGAKKWVTSAMCTPSSRLPFSSSRTCSASSISLHPGGSTLQIGRCRKSILQ